MRRLGVDLVEYKKAKTFYAEHKNRLGGYFDPSEMSFIQKSRRPYESLALLLAAKEAVFKSSRLSWMGPRGFRRIRVLRAGRLIPSLSVFKKKYFVVAECRPHGPRNSS